MVVGAIAAIAMHKRRTSSSHKLSVPSSSLRGQLAPGTISATGNRLPPEEEWLMSGLLEKRIVSSGVFWYWKKLVLTNSKLAIAQPDSTICLDHIQLEDIESIVLTEEGGNTNQEHETEKSFGWLKSWLSPTHSSNSGSGGTKEEVVRAPATDQSVHTNPDRRKSSTVAIPHDVGTFRKRASEIGNELVGAIQASLQQGQHAMLEVDTNVTSTLDITTKADGYNRGRSYTLRGDPHDCQVWLKIINRARAKLLPEDSVPVLSTPFQTRLLNIYQSNIAQGIVCLVILLNFGASIVSAQLNPDEGTELFSALERLDYIFTALFVLELIVNMLGHWFMPFWRDGWNVFDFVVVVISVLAIALDTLPGFKVLRLMRVFRVVRLFRFLSSLRIIINALSAAIIPVANAFGVLVLVTTIYAVIGVNLFRDTVPHHFGEFATSLFTMFQVLTSDGWATSIVRPLFEKTDPAIVAAFFVSYIVIVGTFLVNVVIAVLLDEFVNAVEDDKEQVAEERREKSSQHTERHAGALDPLLWTLTGFNTSRDLTNRIREIFHVLDEDMDGYIGVKDLRDGLEKLAMKSRVHISQEDFDLFTEGGELTDGAGRMGLLNFETMIRAQLASFVQRHVAQSLADSEHHSPEGVTLMFAVKQIMLLLTDTTGILGKESFRREDAAPVLSRDTPSLPRPSEEPKQQNSRRRSEGRLGEMADRLLRMEQDFQDLSKELRGYLQAEDGRGEEDGRGRPVNRLLCIRESSSPARLTSEEPDRPRSTDSNSSPGTESSVSLRNGNDSEVSPRGEVGDGRLESGGLVGAIGSVQRGRRVYSQLAVEKGEGDGVGWPSNGHVQSDSALKREKGERDTARRGRKGGLKAQGGGSVSPGKRAGGGENGGGRTRVVSLLDAVCRDDEASPGASEAEGRAGETEKDDGSPSGGGIAGGGRISRIERWKPRAKDETPNVGGGDGSVTWGGGEACAASLILVGSNDGPAVHRVVDDGGGSRFSIMPHTPRSPSGGGSTGRGRGEAAEDGEGESGAGGVGWGGRWGGGQGGGSGR